MERLPCWICKATIPGPRLPIITALFTSGQRAAEHQEFEQLSLDKLKGRRRAGVKIQAAPASADSKH